MRAHVSEKAAVAVVFTAAVFMSALDTTIVNVALPTIGRDLNAAPTAVGAISVAYLVSLGLFMPASGWLGDRFGGKRVLLAATVIFTVASALCGAATSLGELVAFRVLQGVGGGMMTPVGMAMFFRAFPPDQRLRASAVLVVPTTLAPASGPVLGGLLISELSWRWVFYINVPVGVAAVSFGALFLRHRAESRPGRFDLAGFLLSGAGLGLLMYGVSEGANVGWGSPAILSGLILGAVLLTLAILVERRVVDPMVAVRLFGDRLFRSGTMATVLMSAAFIGTLYVMSLYLQDGRGLSALAAGLSIFPEAVGVAVGSQLASRVLYPRLGPRRHIAAGLGLITVAIGLMALLGARLKPVVGPPAHVRDGRRDGPGDAGNPDRVLRHRLARGDRPGLDVVQRQPPARRGHWRCPAHHRHRPGRSDARRGRSRSRQPRQLPGRVRGGRHHQPGRRAVRTGHPGC